MRLQSHQIDQLTRLADSTARLLEACAAAQNSADTRGAAQLAARLSEVALQMSTTKLTVDLGALATPEAADEFASHLKQAQSEPSAIPSLTVETPREIQIAGFTVGFWDESACYLQMDGSAGVNIPADQFRLTLTRLYESALAHADSTAMMAQLPEVPDDEPAVIEVEAPKQ